MGTSGCQQLQSTVILDGSGTTICSLITSFSPIIQANFAYGEEHEEPKLNNMNVGEVYIRKL